MAEVGAEDEEELQKAEDKNLIRKIQDELNHPLKDPIKESTVGYYNLNKDQVEFTLNFMQVNLAGHTEI